MNPRRLQAYASLAEVVSAFAIVASLVYAGYEFRRSNTMSSREVDVLLYERLHETNRLLIETPGLAEALVVSEADPQSVSPADRLRLLAHNQDFFETWELGWYHYQDGILSEASWGDWNAWFVAEARRRPGLAWGDVRHRFAGGSFRLHVDAVLPPD